MKFDRFKDDEFQSMFLDILTKGMKKNTYKFAFARFLLDYSSKVLLTWRQALGTSAKDGVERRNADLLRNHKNPKLILILRGWHRLR